MIEKLTTPLKEAKVRCATEAHILYFEDHLITQAIIDQATHFAEFHEQRHPSHYVQVMIYEKAPETTDIGGTNVLTENT